MLYQMQKTRGLYFHTCSRFFKNREWTITMFNLTTHKLKVPSISNVHCTKLHDSFLHCTMELVSTEEGTFNFWALEVTDLKENFFCSIPGALCVQRMRVYRIIRLQSLLPLCPNDFPFHQSSESQL